MACCSSRRTRHGRCRRSASSTTGSGFAAVGRFNEFDNLRRGGIQFADTRGYAYDRRDVTGRQLANVYAQTLGTIFTEQAKPYEVELCVAEVAHYGETKPPELYRITYDGSINDEPHFVVMGGTTEPITTRAEGVLRRERRPARRGADRGGALQAGSADVPTAIRHPRGGRLEVAILDQPAAAGVPADHRPSLEDLLQDDRRIEIDGEPTLSAIERSSSRPPPGHPTAGSAVGGRPL